MAYKKLPCMLLRQNCYVLDRAEERKKEREKKNEQLFYETMDEVTRENALVHETRLVPYEITPEFIDSQLASADYRRDPVSAILNAPKRQGLGDIRDFQKVAEMDDTQARDLYAQLQERFATAMKSNEKVQDFDSDSSPSDSSPSDSSPSASAPSASVQSDSFV
ncbi:MAG: hypothetical protein [Microviridae sp.]|nr:MAG: hypothetical protein [Microviridae sp.]